MKNWFIIFLLFFLPLISHAQRLNSKGLKMVSEIEERSYTGERFNGTVKYVFGYDNQNNLVSMKIFDANNKLWAQYNKIGNRVIKKSYSQLDKFCTDTILLDDSGKLIYYKYSSRDIYNKSERSAIFHFNYRYDKDKGEYYIYDFDPVETYNENIHNKKSEISKRERSKIKINYFDTNPDKTFNYGILHIDYKIVNDMNINVLPFIGFGFNYSVLKDILKTEWGNTRSNRFPQYNEDFKTYKYVYTYDKNENLISIKEVDVSLGLIKNDILIKYME